jgi:Tol biopolymer transport system component
MEFAEVVPGKDGKRVFVLGERERGELVHYDSRSGQFVPYLSGISAEAVDFSRDAQWATYVAYPEGALWRSRVDGSERLQLTTSPMQIAAPRWSPDGKRIVFMGQLPDKPWKIYLISANGGNPQQLIPGESGEETPSWSTDGNSIAYGRLPDSSNPGDVRIGVLDLSTQQVSLLPGSEGLGSPKWSPDGRYLACQQFDWLFTGSSEKLMLFDFAARKWAGLADVRTEWPTWSRDGKYLYFVIRSAGDTAEFRVRVSDHKLERIVDLKDLHQAWGPFGPWSGLAPDDSPLAMRDVGTQDIYALDLQLP